MLQQQISPAAIPNDSPPGSMGEAPPKQVALAMDRLAQAGRLIADIRLGADRLLEALFISAQPHQSNKPVNLILKEETSMRQRLQELRNIGKFKHYRINRKYVFSFQLLNLASWAHLSCIRILV